MVLTPHKIKQRVIAYEKESSGKKRGGTSTFELVSEFCANADEHVHDYISTVYFEHPWHVIVRVSLEYFGSVVFTFLILYIYTGYNMSSARFCRQRELCMVSLHDLSALTRRSLASPTLNQRSMIHILNDP